MASLNFMTPSSNSSDQKLSRRALVALVVGSMVGSGIFALPAAFGRATGGLGALIAWCIAGVGMLMLAFVFQSLSRRKPDLDAGIYAYAKAGFGDYPGFASDRKSTRLNSSHLVISYAVFCLKKKKNTNLNQTNKQTPTRKLSRSGQETEA